MQCLKNVKIESGSCPTWEHGPKYRVSVSMFRYSWTHCSHTVYLTQANGQTVDFVKPSPGEYFHIKGPTFLFNCGSTLFHTSSNVWNYSYILKLPLSSKTSVLIYTRLFCCVKSKLGQNAFNDFSAGLRKPPFNTQCHKTLDKTFVVSSYLKSLGTFFFIYSNRSLWYKSRISLTVSLWCLLIFKDACTIG